jgi:hypothetical protein
MNNISIIENVKSKSAKNLITLFILLMLNNKVMAHNAARHH